MKQDAYSPDYAVPPGETLSETIDALSMTREELADRTGLDKKTIDRIIDGTHILSPEVADRLEKVTGVPARIWNNLERRYRELLKKTTTTKRRK